MADAVEQSIAVLADDAELEPGKIIDRDARHGRNNFCSHRAPVIVLPSWRGRVDLFQMHPTVVASDGIAMTHQRGDRLAGLPDELVVRACRALVDLSALRMEKRRWNFARHGDRLRNLRHRPRCGQEKRRDQKSTCDQQRSLLIDNPSIFLFSNYWTRYVTETIARS